MYWIEFVINYFHQLKIKGRGTRGHDVGKYKHGEASPARSGGWVLLHLPTNKLTPHETLFSLFFCPTPHESIVFQTIHLFYFLNKYLLPSFYHTNTLQVYILNKITKTNLPPTWARYHLAFQMWFTYPVWSAYMSRVYQIGQNFPQMSVHPKIG